MEESRQGMPQLTLSIQQELGVYGAKRALSSKTAKLAALISVRGPVPSANEAAACESIDAITEH